MGTEEEKQSTWQWNTQRVGGTERQADIFLKTSSLMHVHHLMTTIFSDLAFTPHLSSFMKVKTPD